MNFIPAHFFKAHSEGVKCLYIQIRNWFWECVMLSDSETSHLVYTICDVSCLNMTKLLILRNSKIPKPLSDVYR